MYNNCNQIDYKLFLLLITANKDTNEFKYLNTCSDIFYVVFMCLARITFPIINNLIENEFLSIKKTKNIVQYKNYSNYIVVGDSNTYLCKSSLVVLYKDLNYKTKNYFKYRNNNSLVNDLVNEKEIDNLVNNLEISEISKNKQLLKYNNIYDYLSSTINQSNKHNKIYLHNNTLFYLKTINNSNYLKNKKHNFSISTSKNIFINNNINIKAKNNSNFDNINYKYNNGNTKLQLKGSINNHSRKTRSFYQNKLSIYNQYICNTNSKRHFKNYSNYSNKDLSKNLDFSNYTSYFKNSKCKNNKFIRLINSNNYKNKNNSNKLSNSIANNNINKHKNIDKSICNTNNDCIKLNHDLYKSNAINFIKNKDNSCYSSENSINTSLPYINNILNEKFNNFYTINFNNLIKNNNNNNIYSKDLTVCNELIKEEIQINNKLKNIPIYKINTNENSFKLIYINISFCTNFIFYFNSDSSVGGIMNLNNAYINIYNYIHKSNNYTFYRFSIYYYKSSCQFYLDNINSFYFVLSVLNKIIKNPIDIPYNINNTLINQINSNSNNKLASDEISLKENSNSILLKSNTLCSIYLKKTNVCFKENELDKQKSDNILEELNIYSKENSLFLIRDNKKTSIKTNIKNKYNNIDKNNVLSKYTILNYENEDNKFIKYTCYLKTLFKEKEKNLFSENNKITKGKKSIFCKENFKSYNTCTSKCSDKDIALKNSNSFNSKKFYVKQINKFNLNEFEYLSMRREIEVVKLLKFVVDTNKHNNSLLLKAYNHNKAKITFNSNLSLKKISYLLNSNKFSSFNKLNTKNSSLNCLLLTNIEEIIEDNNNVYIITSTDNETPCINKNIRKIEYLNFNSYILSTIKSNNINNKLKSNNDLKKHSIFKLKDIKKIFKSLVLIIQKLHSYGIIHRDIRPENFLIKITYFSNNDNSSINIEYDILLNDFSYCRLIGKNQKIINESVGKIVIITILNIYIYLHINIL